jgi:hypothetical protein
MVYIWILMILTVVFDATGDALMKRNMYVLAKIFQMLMILCFGGMIILAQYWPDKLIMWPWWLYFILMYGFIRVGLFNVIWSLVRFKFKAFYWWYLGETSEYDKVLSWIILKIKAPVKHFLFWYYLFAFLGSLAVLIQGFYLIHE